jgi:hypothetical protein
LITWPINWDVYASCSFSDTHRNFLDSLLPFSTDEIHQEDDLTCTLFPNPVTDNISISFTLKNTSDVELSIYNCKGQLVKSHRTDETALSDQNIEISARDLVKGIYIMKLTIDAQKKYHKFIVAK